MTCTLTWQSTGRDNRTLLATIQGQRATLLVREATQRRRRGRRLAAAIRQFQQDEIDDRDLLEELRLANVSVSRINSELIAEHFETCDDCGECCRRDDCIYGDDQAICDSCQENYSYCQRCDNLTHDNCITYIDEQSVCDDCRDEHYFYWESDGEWHDEPEPEDNLIRPYNVTLTGPLGVLPLDRRAEHVLGAELELEVDDPQEFAEAIDATHSPDECHCKHDGSLDDNRGVEVVTGHGALKDLLPVLDSVATIARSHGGKSHDATACGLHIGLDRSQFSAALQAKIIVFWNYSGNYEFLRQFTRRDFRKNSYCRVKAEKATRDFLDRPDLASGDKYEIVNTRHRSHLEVRAFRGSLLPGTLRACSSLVSLIASFCDQAAPEPSDLTAAAFVRWVETVDDDRKAAISAYLAGRQKSLSDFGTAAHT